MRWFGYLLATLAAAAVFGGGYWLHISSDAYASERVVALCRTQFSADFPGARARNWGSEVHEDFAKVYATTPSLGFDYGCHLGRTGLAWAVEPEAGVRTDGNGKVLFQPQSPEPLQPGQGGGPSGCGLGVGCLRASERL